MCTLPRRQTARFRAASILHISGAQLGEFERMQPDARIINLETSITRSEDYAPKGINYRMSPENADCLKAAAIDCCVLGNNHILDWGRRGLLDTLATLEHLQIKTSGAGRNLGEASAPAVLDIAGNGRVLVFSFACVTSGTPRSLGRDQRDSQALIPSPSFPRQAPHGSPMKSRASSGRTI